MFDEDAKGKEPESYFKEIEQSVLDLCEDYGIVDQVWLDQNSPGNVWIKFNPQSIEGSQKVQEILNKKKFDGREIRAQFVSVAVFNSKVPLKK